MVKNKKESLPAKKNFWATTSRKGKVLPQRIKVGDSKEGRDELSAQWGSPSESIRGKDKI